MAKNVVIMRLQYLFQYTVLTYNYKTVDPDSHSFSLLDPDPGGKNFKIKTDKMQGNWK